MLRLGERLRLLLAVGELVDRGLLAPESDPELAAVRIDGHGFRYCARFWTVTGVLRADGPDWRVRLQDDGEAARVRHRVAAEWITAGAPIEWARMEAEAAVMLLRVRCETAARA